MAKRFDGALSFLGSQEEDCFEGPAFLENSASELQKHEELGTKNQRVFSKNFEQFYSDLRTECGKCRWDVRHKELLTSLQKKKRELALVESKADKLQRQIDNLHAECNILRPKVAEKQDELVTLSQECQESQEHTLQLQLECDEMRKNANNRFNALTNAKKIYKQWLDCCVRLTSNDGGNTYVLTFSNPVSHEKQDMPYLSIKLLHNSENKWQLLDSNPSLPTFDHLVDKLKSTQDINGLIAFVRQEFKVKK